MYLAYVSSLYYIFVDLSFKELFPSRDVLFGLNVDSPKKKIAGFFCFCFQLRIIHKSVFGWLKEEGEYYQYYHEIESIMLTQLGNYET